LLALLRGHHAEAVEHAVERRAADAEEVGGAELVAFAVL